MSPKNSQLFWCLILVFLSSDIFSNCVVTAIRGGDFDYVNEYNYQVSIQKKKVNGYYEHGCGGSIIGKKYVLTAAHCFVSKKGQVLNPTNDIRILAGTSNLHKGGIIRYIDIVFIPRTYRHENHLAIDDIAVVQLKNSLFSGLNKEYPQDLQTIPLFENFNYAKLEKQTAIISGFGVTEPNAATASVTRKYLKVMITKERNCPKLNSIVCVFSLQLGNGAQGFCYGDSGGPVVVDGKVLGVVSRGAKDNCDLTSKIGKITFVPHYLDFIKAATDIWRDKYNIIILPDMMKEAETIFKPATRTSKFDSFY